MNLLFRLKHRITHIRFHPIRVFLFHQVAEVYDPSQCHTCDWMHIDQFKAIITELKKYYSFISLSQAYQHLCHDFFRLKRYAVLSCDDGSACLKNILPWLRDQCIPITLFINGKYLDGISYRESPAERYLSEIELNSLDYDGVEIAHHGWEHKDMTVMEWGQFTDSVARNIKAIKKHPNYIPFWAYTWGKHTREQDDYLRSLGIIPVLIDGMKNYQERNQIHRELLDGLRLHDLDLQGDK